LQYFSETETAGTEKFCGTMNKFFDYLNLRCSHAWKENKKTNLKPYTKPDDPRLKVYIHIVYKVHELLNECYGVYACSGWKMIFCNIAKNGKTVLQNTGQILTPSDKQLMQISHATLEGMTITGTSIFVYTLMIDSILT